MGARNALTRALIFACSGVWAAASWGECGSCMSDLSYLFNPHVLYSNPNGRVLTVQPDGSGDSLESLGITIDLRIECGAYDPPLSVCGLPAAEMILFNPNLCFCEAWHAAAASDSLGRAHFSGSPRAGGCARSITVFIDGVAAGTIPLRINSPDTGTASGCAVDQSDLAALAAKLGRPEAYDFCFDYNDDGATDAGDIAAFAQALGHGCTLPVIPLAGGR